MDLRGAYKLRNNVVKDENCDLLAHSHNISNRCKNYFYQLLNTHRVSNDKQIEIHTAKQLVFDPSPFEDEIAIVKFKSKNHHVVIKFWQN
jgi:hypothetical protein